LRVLGKGKAQSRQWSNVREKGRRREEKAGNKNIDW
jgi:hypothetical protein